VAEFMQESIAFLVRVQCRRKESSRSLSHLLMSFLFFHPPYSCIFSQTAKCFVLRIEDSNTRTAY